MPEQEPPAEGPANVSVHGQGTQVGTANVQHNHYGQRPPRDLSALSVRAAVTYINQLTHDEVVDLFAHILPDDLADILRVLLRTDESKVLNILADLKPQQAAELVNSLTGDFPWLVDLPKAATAIAQQALELRWDHAPGTGGIERAPQSPHGTGGYFQRYQQGSVHWGDDEGKTYAVSRAFAEVYLGVGGTCGELGFPIDVVRDWTPGSGTEGTEQIFEFGYIDSSPHGTYAVYGRIGLAILGDELDWRRLGYPIGVAEARGDATRQPFEAGTVYASDAGTFAVWPDFESLTDDCFPVSAEEDIPSTDAGRMQRFKDDSYRLLADGDETIAMYRSDRTKACRVNGQRLALYERLGGPASVLGFPASPVTVISMTPPGARDHRGLAQRFEYGTIYHDGGRDPVVVPADTVELVVDRLGWPVSGEESIGSNPADRIQFFEYGVFTRRSEKLEMWLRP